MDTASLVQPGRQLEFFEIVGELPGTLEVPEYPSTTAGYADIYRGFWTTPQGDRVQVAIKELRTLIPRDRQTEREALKWKAELRLKREAFVWSQTTHPNLHPLIGYCSRPRPRLISPWCSQGNLKDYLEANQSLTRCDKLRLIFQTACGLEHLHSRTPPICHADIKPENVLINDWYGPALSDFGLSRVVQDLEARSGFTTSETVKGTVRYMASELFAGHKPSLETDVYAFGGLILTVMSRKAPFEGLLHQVILRRVTLDEPPIPKDHPNLPAHDPLWKLMRRCWNNDPTVRPTMQEVLRELLGEVIREESSSGSRLHLASSTDDGASEYRDMDLDIPGALQDGANIPSLTTNTVPGAYSLSAMPVPDAISGELLFATRKTLKTVQLNSKVIPIMGKFIGTAAQVGLSLVEIVEAMNERENVSNSLEHSPWRLANILWDLGEQSRQHQGGNIRARFTEIQRELEFAQEEIKERYSSNLVRKVLEEIQFLVTLDTTGLLNEFENTEAQEQSRRLLNRLGGAKYGAQGNAIEDVVCLPGTRVEILERIDNWIRDKSTPDRVLWIRGMAGRGKSTIASTVVHNWQSRASCAIFHFRRGHNTLNARFVCALARQLGSSLIPDVRNAVLESVQENEDIADQRLDVQFETLFVVPLSKLVHQSRTILFILDALDESPNSKDVVDFVKLIDRHSTLFPINVKFLLTCRPEAELLRALEPKKWLVEDLDSSANVIHDLTQFIKQGCTQIRDDHGLPESWPASSDVQNLVEMSQGLFQWAQTVITYISNGSPVNRLRDLLKRPSTWDGLDDLYHQILSNAFDAVRRDPVRQELLRSILGTLVVAPYPVSLEIIAALYGDNSTFEGVDQEGVIEYLRQDILMDLNSLLLIPTSPAEHLHLMHTSIRDLLINKQRCSERVYYIDVRHHHKQLASLCLGIMVRCLKENMCNLSDLSKPNSEVQDIIERKVSTALRYCSRAWSVHLTEGVEWPMLVTKGPDNRRTEFETFSKEKLLYWLEVMSLIGATTEAIVIAKHVYSWLSRSHEGAILDSKWLTTLWNDAQRFIAAFSEPISFGALHIYTSALAHCPQKTQLWECYGTHARIRSLRGVQPLTWPPNLWTRYVGAEVTTIAFSPDGAVLAFVSPRGTIRLYDAQTGTPLGQPLTGHSAHINSVAFSPDGKVLASRSSDRTIRLWDAQTGTPLGQPLTCNNGKVIFATFSPDGKALASGSNDGMIRLWDAQTGTPLGQPLTCYNDSEYFVTFSPDGKVLASQSDVGTIQLWDTQTGTPLGQLLRGVDEWVTSVVFSPDGKVLASASEDGTIQLWDAQTGTPLGQPLTGDYDLDTFTFSPDGQVLASLSDDFKIQLWNTQTGTPLGQPPTGDNDCVTSVAFSPDGKVLASGYDDGTIQLRDAQTGTPLGQPLTGHHDWINSIAYSPDGKTLASGSEDGTIRLWDAQTEKPLGQQLTGHQGRFESVAFSSDGKVLASGSNDGTIRLWDAQTGTPLDQPLTGHSTYVGSVAFSPDGKVLASGSCDHTIRLWDAQTGTPLGQPLTHPHFSVRYIAFSPDGKVLASECEYGKTRLWDAQTGTRLGQLLKRDNDQVASVAFSPDPKILASGSDDGTIQLWDARTGTPLGQPLTGGNDWVNSVAFSPDGKALAPGSNDRTIRLWDAQTGTPLGQPLIGHNRSVTSVAFSPDGKVLASGSTDGTIRLWDAQTGTPLGQPLTDHNEWIKSIAYSPDGKALASGSDYGTIRLWDAQTGTPLGQPLTGHNHSGHSVDSVAFSPDGKALASGSGGTIRLWDAQTGTPLGQPMTHDRLRVGWIIYVVFSPDGKVLASGSNDGKVRLWDAKTGTLLGQPLTRHTKADSVHSLALSPDTKVLASGHPDGTIRLRDAQTGTPLGQPLTGHNASVYSTAFSPDGKVLASGSRDRTIRLWDAQAGTPLGQPLTAHDRCAISVAFSPDGKVLASGSDDGTIGLWDAHTGIPFGLSMEDGSRRHPFLPLLYADARELLRRVTLRIPKIQKHWLTLSSSRFFWLPSEYWADEFPKIILSNGTLVIVSDGRLSIFDVSRVL